MLNTWQFFFILYLIFFTLYTQLFKLAVKNSKDEGAVTVLIQIIVVTCLIPLVPFYGIKYSTDPKIYFWLGLASIFFAISDRINTIGRKHLEISLFITLRQLTKVFLVLVGVLVFKEDLTWAKVLGSLLILSGNIVLLYQKGKWHWNKYVIYSILGSIALAVGISVDIGINKEFNLPLYIMISMFLPTFYIFIAERIKIKSVLNEYKLGNKLYFWGTGFAWGWFIFFMYRSFQLGEVTVISPLSAIAILINTILAYFIHKETSHKWKKIAAAILVIVGIYFVV